MKARRTSESVADLNEILENEEDSDQLRDELNACQHLLTDTEMENGRHKVFNFRLSKLNPNQFNEKLNQVFEKFDCAAKINIALGFVLRKIERANIVFSTLMKLTHSLINLHCFVLKQT